MERDLLVVGEALVDVVHTPDGAVVARPGGSAANVAVALSRLGRPVRFATAFTGDEHGTMLAEHLDRNGVLLASDPAVIDHSSSAVATIAEDGSASYVFDLEWRIGEVPSDPPPLAVHVCSIGAVLAPGAEQVRAVAAVARPDATITYDVNARPSITGTGPEVVAATEAVVALADLVKLSDEDLDHLWPGLGLDAGAAHLRALGASVVVVTRGADGASWFDAAGRTDVPGRRVTVADTIGAGDTFSAALVDGLAGLGRLGGRIGDLGRGEVEGLLAHAAAAAAVTVSRPGADPPTRAELDAAEA
ncbi:PfkB family carbohydrate kinase [Nocardioides bruguierae]|uniref:PfkB family carbohydrate kinase n=1 Tax=Nocardioides bruguierae TaxID=2945102 RepID=UPI00202233CD|nr:PfkB family carbohydrate kinase [Nocardioides bruguierae]MCL8027276.1 PfkB family carbohydrate kinase [Nocardioides bruguierae]